MSIIARLLHGANDGALSPAVRRGGLRGPIFVRSVRAGSSNGFHRAEAIIGNEPVWFESPDLPLAASKEAFGSAFLFPAATKRRRLAFESPVDPTWLKNVPHALDVAAQWWRSSGPVEPPDNSIPAEVSSNGQPAALCFSLGVDSFYSLMRGGIPVSAIVLAHGYDIALDDMPRFLAAEKSLRAVASALGIKAVVIRTNLRSHPAFCARTWNETHGGALAAMGHLLSNHFGQLLISASYPIAFDQPWGSHWKLDRWWSSSKLNILHIGADKWRAEKLTALVSEQLVRQHLRVCWENKSESGNCGVCEKCLRTMIVLDSNCSLEDFPMFPPPPQLVKNLNELPTLKPHIVPLFAKLLELPVSRDVRVALEKLVERSSAPVPA